MSLPAVSFGYRFCASRRGRTGGGGWVHLKGETAWSYLVLAMKSPGL